MKMNTSFSTAVNSTALAEAIIMNRAAVFCSVGGEGAVLSSKSRIASFAGGKSLIFLMKFLSSDVGARVQVARMKGFCI